MKALRRNGGGAGPDLWSLPATAQPQRELRARHETGQLWLAVHVPRLPLYALGAVAPDAPPRAVSEHRGGRGRILVVDAKAAAAGVTAGMSVSGACGLCPRLGVHARDEAAEGAARR